MRSARADEGSGTVLGIAVLGAIMAVCLALVPLYVVLSSKGAVAAAADVSALAAADARVGVATGYPCERAAEVARANGAELLGCEVDGLVATVTVGRSIAGFDIQSTATAGPPH